MPRLRNLLTIALALLCCAAERSDMAQYASLRNLINMRAIRAHHPDSKGFTFIVLGDDRDSDDVYRKLLMQVNDYAAAHTGAERPTFVLHTGDMVAHGTTEEWQRYASLRNSCTLPMVHVRGNHEIRATGGASNYGRFVGNPMWVFDYGGCRFIGMDNSNGHFTPQSISVLRIYLGLPGADGSQPVLPSMRRSFIVMHQPPYVGRWQVHAMRPDGLGDQLVQAAAEAHASAVFCGHIHLYDEMDVSGVPYIISGGAGAPLYGSYGFGKAEHGFVVVHVTPAQVSWDWVPAQD
jgi:predicted phosphodiesterase